jgi:hypothetical protein
METEDSTPYKNRSIHERDVRSSESKEIPTARNKRRREKNNTRSLKEARGKRKHKNAGNEKEGEI